MFYNMFLYVFKKKSFFILYLNNFLAMFNLKRYSSWKIMLLTNLWNTHLTTMNKFYEAFHAYFMH